MQATKKPHNYHKTVVWQKDDRIRKSPLKFYVYYYSELSGDCQVSIFTELWRLSVAFCVTLWHMSICAGIVIPITFQKVDNTPDTQASAEGDNEGLQDSDSLGKKCHTVCAGIVYQVWLVMVHRHTKAGSVCTPVSGGLIPAFLLLSYFCGDCPLCTPMAS